MTEAEWNTCPEPTLMLDLLRGRTSDRKMRLFSLVCVKRFQSELAHLCMERTRKAILVSEEYIDCQVPENEYQAAVRDALEEIENNVLNHRLVNWSGSDMAHTLLADVPHAAAAKHIDLSMDFAFDTVVGKFDEDESDDEAWERATRPIAFLLCGLLRCIFGNPFRPVSIDPAFLTPTVQSLADSIYQERAFDRLPVLADALEEAGCANADILAHCRQPGVHTRGCWSLDLILGKE